MANVLRVSCQSSLLHHVFVESGRRRKGAVKVTNVHNEATNEKGNSNASCVFSRRKVFLTTSLIFSWSFNTSEWFSCNLNMKAKALGEKETELEVIRTEIRKVLTKSKAAGVLRLVFHDAGTFDAIENSGGMNGSILYELDRPENVGLTRPLKVLEKVKASLNPILNVSWADLISVAGAEAVAICGGPEISVKLGRIDIILPDAQGQLPAESLDSTSLKKCFKEKGFLTQELVVLSGAHTLGNKGFGDPNVFDNSYFQILLQKPWTGNGMAMMIGLPSDRALVDDDECMRWVTLYAHNQQQFFHDFSAAYVKLVNSGAHWKTLS